MSSSIDNADGRAAYYDINGNHVVGPTGIVAADYRRHYSKQVYANSYPSGHSSAIWSVALFLMEVLPEKADLIMKAANQYCVGRQITRYHWNSDTIIGRLVGATIAPVIRASADYSTLLSASRAEVPSNISSFIGASWVDSISQTGITEGKYLWTRKVTFYSDNTSTVEYSVSYWAVDGGGEKGDTGHVGRWYYYAGEYDGTPGHYTMEPTRAPYVSYRGNYYMLDFNGVETSAHERTASVHPDTDGNTEWSSMQATFKYIITEATFSDNAHLSAFVFNGDWVISTNGTINGVEYNSSNWKNPAMYGSVAAYTKFDPSNPNTNTGTNFIPNFAVDGLTGTTYQNKGFFRGTINATGGSITENMTIGTEDNKMQIYVDEPIGNPAVNKGSGIRGINGNTQLLNLGFQSNNYPFLTMSAPTWTGMPITTVFPGFIRFSYGNGYAEIGMSANGKLNIYVPSSYWPTYDQVGAGEVYLDGDVLKVRL